MQQQQTQEPQQPAAAAPQQQHPDGSREGAKAQSRARSTSSEETKRSEDTHGIAQLRRNLRELREEVEDGQDEFSLLQRQTLFLLQQSVQRDRREASLQLVVQGFDVRKESPNLDEAMDARDRWMKDTFSALARVPAARVNFTASHSTNLERLSRLAVISFSNPQLVSTIARNATTMTHYYMGTPVVIRRQNCLWDRLTSAPAKIGMELITSQRRSMEKKFRPQWREGKIFNDDFSKTEPALEWTVNVQAAKLRVWVAPEFYEAVENGMQIGLNRLQFGHTAAQASGVAPEHGGPTKGKGKAGKGKQRFQLPLDKAAWRNLGDRDQREGLNNLSFARYPFSVTVKKMENRNTEPEEAEDVKMEQTAQKRYAEDEPASNKRRSPTPGRSEKATPDPWAAAATSTASAAASTPYPAPRPEPVKMGDRISA